MPEIAEVRTVAKALKRKVLHKKIINIDILYDKIIEGDIKQFKGDLLNREITDINNYGKWLFITLDDITIMSHLRMEGKYYFKSIEEPITKHEHIIFYLDDNSTLRYHDTRKFGKMILVKTKDIYKTKEISKLGIEPDSKDLTNDYIYNKINKKNLPIKTLLLDQSIINGLGNIYANEVLFASKINPYRKGKSITLDEIDLIRKSSHDIIRKATECGGTTIRSYTSELGVKGGYQDYLLAHSRENKPCKICNNPIKKEFIGGRSIYYCSNCQK